MTQNLEIYLTACQVGITASSIAAGIASTRSCGSDLPEERREDVLSALDVDTLPISEIVVPAEDIVILSTTVPTEANVEQIRNTPIPGFRSSVRS